VTTAPDAATARATMAGLVFDVVILDVMMPGENGLSLARDLKSTSNVPICMLTARAEPEERIEGLEVGVDDYVAKPFEPRELLLRLQNILKRRQRPSGPREEVTMGDFVFHVERGELRRGEESIKLTERERELLRHFAQRPGTPVARHELAADDSTGTERAIDVQINRLRRKIESDPANPVYLQTVRGKGYILYTD
jgi:two-component system phosphate regulon response regulator OmpR